MTAGKKKPKVALLIETSRSYGRGIYQGVTEYAREHGGWDFVWQENSLDAGIPAWLRDWRGDGVICRIFNSEIADVLSSLGCPVVDVCGLVRHPDIPCLDTDATAVAKMAVEFFTRSAYGSFAFCGYPGLWFSDEREQEFTSALQSAGFTANVYAPPKEWSNRDIASRESLHPDGSEKLTEWAASLPPRTAILCCNDNRARQLLSAAASAGCKVPEDLIILGVDNDELVCDLADPPLSSIVPDTFGIGRMAAKWLDRMMSGNQPSSNYHRLPPLSVHERASTALTNCDNEWFVKAARFIREFSDPAMTTDSVARHVGCSRSSLEKRFRKLLGRSVTQEIGRTRMLHVEMLLRDKTITLSDVAHLCGFTNASHFSRVFRETKGMTPGQYRIQHTATSQPSSD